MQTEHHAPALLPHSPLQSTTPPSAPLPPSSLLTLLQHIHERYLRVPAVSRWLLARDAVLDFHVVNHQTAVLVSTDPITPPHFTNSPPVDVPFPAADDLSFLDHDADGFALGHVWGNFQADTHPFAPLASATVDHRWHKVRSRKFASELSVSGALESVEYTWFHDDSAIITISRTLFSTDLQPNHISLILFFTSHSPPQTPDVIPDLALFTSNHTVCTLCDTVLCSCPDSFAPPHSNRADCVSMRLTRADGSLVDAHYLAHTWPHRTRIVSKGSKRGELTVVFNPFSPDIRTHVTMRQQFSSIFHNQHAISSRIEQHFTRFLSKLPQLQSTLAPAPMPVSSPCYSVSQSLLSNARIAQTFPSASDIAHTASNMSMPLPSLAAQNETAWLSSSRIPVQAPLVRTSFSAPPGTSDVRIQPDSIADAANASGDSSALIPSTCAQEKAAPNCPSPPDELRGSSSLSRILNTRGAPLEVGMLPRLQAPVSSSLSRHGIIGDLSSAGRVEEDKDSTKVLHSLVGNIDSHSSGDSTVCPPGSGRSGASGSSGVGLPSMPASLEMGLPMAPGSEPVLKRPRTDGAVKMELSLGIPTGSWSTPIHNDTKEKELNLPSCYLTSLPERPLSGLGPPLGSSHSPSLHRQPVGTQKASMLSPPVHMVSTRIGCREGELNGVVGKAAGLGHEVDLSNEFDGLPPLRDVGSTALNVDGICQVGTGNIKGGMAAAAEIVVANAGAKMIKGCANASNGVCCEICGITFAKRGNKIRHILTVHNRLRQFECDLCDAKFGLKADLGRHRFRIHESRAFVCETCGKSFAEEAQLQMHVRVTHEEDARPWECKKCQIRFGRKSSLTRHEQTVHQHTRFECRVCKKSYSQRFDAIRHERKVHNLYDKDGGVAVKRKRQ